MPKDTVKRERTSPDPVLTRPVAGNPSDILERAVRARIRQLVDAGCIKLIDPRSRNTPADSDEERFMRPRMDVCDDLESAMTIALLELPGMNYRDISISIQEGQLVIQGDRSRESSSDQPVNAAYRVQQLRYGKFRCFIPVPPDTQSTDVKAHFSNGMLKVNWPMRTTTTATPLSS